MFLKYQRARMARRDAARPGNKWLPLACLSLASLLIFACAPAPTSGPEQAGPVSTSPSPAGPPVGKWEELVAAARKEGTVTFYSQLSPQARAAIVQEFYKDFGIRVEMVSSTGSQIVAKIRSERQAGLYVPDLVSTGALSTMDLKGMGAVQPIEPLIVLPDALDSKAWPEGKPVFFDKDRTVAVIGTYYQPFVLINTDMVKTGELVSNEDLLNPKWKGKIVFYDPTIAGTGVYWVVLLRMAKGEEWAASFFKRFTNQDVVITRDPRMHAEWVARGRYPVGIGYSAPVVGEFLSQGLPILPHTLKEGGFLASGGVVVMTDRAPHPKAAAVMVNWLLSHKGSRLFAEGNGYMPARQDMTPTWVHPALIPPKGAKLVYGDEDFLTFLRDHGRTVARQYFGEVIK